MVLLKVSLTYKFKKMSKRIVSYYFKEEDEKRKLGLIYAKVKHFNTFGLLKDITEEALDSNYFCDHQVKKGRRCTQHNIPINEANIIIGVLKARL